MTRQLVTLGDCWGADTSQTLTPVQWLQYADAAYTDPQGAAHTLEFAVRYVSLGPEGKWDLTPAEVDACMATHVVLVVVQRVRMPSWIASGAQGAADGKSAALNAAAVGYLAAADIACDMEGVQNPGQPCFVHLMEKAKALYGEGGHRMPIYEGYDCGLTPAAFGDLCANLIAINVPCPIFWSDFAARQPPPRGFAGKQLTNTKPIAGVLGAAFDADHFAPDLQGGCFVGMADREVNEEPGDTAAGQTPLPAA